MQHDENITTPTPGYIVAIHHTDIDFAVGFPAITSHEAACSLALMMTVVYPDADIKLTKWALSGDRLVEAEAATKRMMDRLVAAWETERPGHAFLEGLGYKFEQAANQLNRV